MLDLRDAYAVPPPPAVELRAFTHGLMPRSVPALMQGFCDDWAERGVDAWNGVPDRWGLGHETSWWALPTDLADAYVAPILGAPRGSCILQPNVHWSVQALLSCDEPFAGPDGRAGGRTDVVFSQNEFPSVRHSVQRWAGLRALRPVEAPAGPDGFLDVDALCDAVTDRTAWVFVSHIGFTTGELVPDAALARVVEAARAHGAHVCVDGYHATASVPVDVTALGVDAYLGGLLKEASGSTGNAYLYVRPGCALTPRLAGWFADADPFGFHDAPRDHPEVRRRFLAGTTAVASMYHAVEGLRILLAAHDGAQTGVAAVRADALAKTARAIDRGDAAGLALRSPRAPGHRGAMTIFEVEAADRLCGWLKTQGVYTDSRRGRYLRLAPFVWNPAEDIDRAFDAVEAGLRSGAYLRWEPAAEGGPVT